MTTPEAVVSDISYVRRLVERAAAPDVAAIYFLWAWLIGVGFVTGDVFPDLAIQYWIVAGIIGFPISAWLGYTGARGAGQLDKALGVRHLLHWSSLMVILGLGAATLGAAHQDAMQLVRFLPLFLALTYFTAAIHFQRRLAWLGAAAVAAFVMTTLGVSHAGLYAGAVFALTALAAGFSALAASRRNG